MLVLIAEKKMPISAANDDDAEFLMMQLERKVSQKEEEDPHWQLLHSRKEHSLFLVLAVMDEYATQK